MARRREKKINEQEKTYEGCYGQRVKYDRLLSFITTNFELNDINEQSGQPRFAQCIWGHPGIGKTALVKQLKNTPVEWRGKKYDGWDIRDVPIAQFEEMGDLHGIPMDCILMYKIEGKGPDSERKEQWVPQREQTVVAFREDGWQIDSNVTPRTIMAPPDWVPLKPGPAILLLDDFNRASIRIIKGIMQLLQNYGMVSWKLPPGCNIVLTGNPDEQDYLVTTIDAAIITRIKHITLQEDAKQWAEWATSQNLDARGISFCLFDPEMMIGKERTNPRTLSEFFRYMKTVPSVEDLDGGGIRKDVSVHAHSLLDEETVAAFFVFCTRDMEDVIEPEDVLDGKKNVADRVKKLMKRKEPRTDILGITCERLFATMVQSETEQTPARIKNFQKFVTNEVVPPDIRHSLCKRLSKRTENDGRNQKWLIGDEKLREQILEMLR